MTGCNGSSCDQVTTRAELSLPVRFGHTHYLPELAAGPGLHAGGGLSQEEQRLVKDGAGEG